MNSSDGKRANQRVSTFFTPAANEFAVAQSESPGMVSRARDPDSRVGDDVGMGGSDFDEAISRIDAQIHFMMAIRNCERLQSTCPVRSKVGVRHRSRGAFSIIAPMPRVGLDGAEQNETTVGLAFHQHIQHPMRPVAKINVGGAGLVLVPDKRPGCRS